MAHILVEKSHSMSVEQVKKLLDEAFMKDLDDFDVAADWVGDVCKIKGKGANGSLTVEPGRVVFELTTSILARAEGTDARIIESEVRSRLQQLLR